MDTLHCGYPVPPMASMGLGAAPIAPIGLGASPMSPPVTPTELSHNCSPTDSGFSSPDFLEDHYSSSHCSQSRTPPNHFEEPLLSTSSDHFDLSSSSHPRLSPPTSPSFTPESTPVHTPMSTTPRKLSRYNDRSRKNSFVYDVRLTDEQFLFFVPDPDLVKSHLMFAVREEVEVLKEKIGELMDRISQLEYENTVLRQCATQDALQQIAQPHQNSNT